MNAKRVKALRDEMRAVAGSQALAHNCWRKIKHAYIQHRREGGEPKDFSVRGFLAKDLNGISSRVKKPPKAETEVSAVHRARVTKVMDDILSQMTKGTGIVILLAILAGCHGSELRLGVGRDWSDVNASSSNSGSDYDRDNEDSSSSSFSTDDDYRAWVELAFQLTPTSVVLTESRSIFPESAPVEPAVAVHEHALTMEEVEALLTAREAGYITWETLTGTGVVGGGGLGALMYLLNRRTQKQFVAANDKG